MSDVAETLLAEEWRREAAEQKLRADINARRPAPATEVDQALYGSKCGVVAAGALISILINGRKIDCVDPALDRAVDALVNSFRRDVAATFGKSI